MDLKDVYLQLPFEDMSKDLLVISTKREYYRYKKCILGFLVPLGHFKSWRIRYWVIFIEQLFFLVNVMISSDNMIQHKERLESILEIL